MNFKIKLNNKPNKSITFNSIVEKINGEKYIWSLLYLEARGDLGCGQSMVEFEEKISNSPIGVIMSWNDLINFSMKVDDTVDLLLVGCRKLESIKKFESDDKMYETCDTVIEMIDSSYWLIHSKDKNIINNLSNVKSNCSTSKNNSSITLRRGIAEPFIK